MSLGVVAVGGAVMTGELRRSGRGGRSWRRSGDMSELRRRGGEQAQEAQACWEDKAAGGL